MAYSPAGNATTTATLRHLATVWYDRVALDQLMAVFQFNNVADPDEIPLRNGKTCQWFRYTLLGANTSPASEGAVGPSITMDSTTVTATVSEYSDFVTWSTLLDETAIDPIAENFAINLAYRAGLSVDTITRAEFDSTATPETGTIGVSGTIQDLRKAVALLMGANVRPRSGPDFVGIIHPYVLFDITADNTAGGFVDVMRYANPDTFVTGQVYPTEAGKVEGVRLLKTTNVKTSGAAPNTLYWTYVVGKGACGALSLAGRAPSKVNDPTRQRFKVNVIAGGKPSIYDPTGTIGGACSYRFVYAAKLLDTTTYRYKMIKMDSSII